MKEYIESNNLKNSLKTLNELKNSNPDIYEKYNIDDIKQIEVEFIKELV